MKREDITFLNQLVKTLEEAEGLRDKEAERQREIADKRTNVKQIL